MGTSFLLIFLLSFFILEERSMRLYFYFFCFPIYFLHFHTKRISREFPGFFPYPFDFSIPGKR